MMRADLELEVECFNLKYTLECGQCFRWKCINDNEYIGVIEDRVIRIKQEENKLLIWSNKKENLGEVVGHYFDLEKDYTLLEVEISKIDENIAKSLEFSSGIRILNQPLFETIISYIISANNNIKRISRSVNDISKRFGKEIEFEGEKYYLFPTLEEIKDITIDDLLSCGTGFRARYIKHDIEYFLDDQKFFERLKMVDTDEATKLLSSLMGVGPKVADCILLFALGKGEVFPIDVWVKRIMEKLYFKENKSLKEIKKYANNKFGKHGGIVQQHLFHNVREGNI
ncbi:MAG: 8-oxoguanine DNA glycosylase [Clostridia bacterium]|nr:8-oxoguanine DNA glycosylase [Clostridia bacterium]